MIKTEKKVVFLHLPKTGGTSLHNLIANHFKIQDTFPERYDKLDIYSTRDLNKYKYFSGHYSWNNMLRIPGDKHLISLFREPKERILSTYYYLKSFTDDYIKKCGSTSAVIAKKHSLIDFLHFTNSGNCSWFDNGMARQLSQYGQVVNCKERSSQLKKIEEDTLINLGKVDSIGILEEMHDSIELIMCNLNLDWDGQMPKINALNDIDPCREKIKKEIVTREVEERLNYLTVIDQKIYDEALGIFHKKNADRKNVKTIGKFGHFFKKIFKS